MTVACHELRSGLAMRWERNGDVICLCKWQGQETWNRSVQYLTGKVRKPRIEAGRDSGHLLSSQEGCLLVSNGVSA